MPDPHQPPFATPGALDDLLRAVYPELRRMAGALMARERSEHTLQPTALVHEFFLRVLGNQPPAFNDRKHFFVVASQAMRRVLAEHARTRSAAKRGGGIAKAPLNETSGATADDGYEYVELNRALERLEATDPRAAQIVELRFFGGLTQEETAEVLDISTATVERDWEYARAWLYRALGGRS